MPERIALVKPPEPEPELQLKYFSTGCTVLDQALGGGWMHGRVISIAGDAATGKSLLTIEAFANFAASFGSKNTRYNEAEGGGFDIEYAHRVGLPEDVHFVDDDGSGHYTVQKFDIDFENWISGRKDPSLYALDSVDAISDDAEMARDEIKQTYRTTKAMALSEFFRRHVKQIETTPCTLILVSQFRTKIGVTFGETRTVSGGNAMRFYPSQIVWLKEVEKERRTVDGVKYVTGVWIRALVKKNRLSKAHAEVDFLINFNYGIDDELSNIEWLKANKLGMQKLNISLDKYAGAVERARRERDRVLILRYRQELQRAVRGRWGEIQDALAPTVRKYE